MSDNEFGYRVGLCYSLFCFLISGLYLLGAWIEDSSLFASRLGALTLENSQSKAKEVVKAIVGELTQLSGERPSQIYLLPAKQVSIFVYCPSLEYKASKSALFISQGALFHLTRGRLKMAIKRSLLELQEKESRDTTLINLAASGFIFLFTSGMTLLQHAHLGPFERFLSNRASSKNPSSLFLIGFVPALLGLPSLWLTRLALYLLKSKKCKELDLAACYDKASAHELIQGMKAAELHYCDDLAPSCFLFHLSSFYANDFLSNLLPLQPSLEERVNYLEKHFGKLSS